jgi:hypothetical protein
MDSDTNSVTASHSVSPCAGGGSSLPSRTHNTPPGSSCLFEPAPRARQMDELESGGLVAGVRVGAIPLVEEWPGVLLASAI